MMVSMGIMITMLVTTARRLRPNLLTLAQGNGTSTRIHPCGPCELRHERQTNPRLLAVLFAAATPAAVAFCFVSACDNNTAVDPLGASGARGAITLPPSADSRTRIDVGSRLYEEGEFEQTLEVLRPLIDVSPPESPALLLAARAHAHRGAHRRAALLLARILEFDPHHADAYEELARNRRRLGREIEVAIFLRAASNIESATSRRQGTPRGHTSEPIAAELKVAMTLADRGAVFAAVQRFSKAYESMESPTALLCASLGTLYRRLGRTREAVPLLERALELAGDPSAGPLPSAALVRRDLAAAILSLLQDDIDGARVRINALRQSILAADERLRFDLFVAEHVLDAWRDRVAARDIAVELLTLGAEGPRSRVALLTLRLLLHSERVDQALALLRSDDFPERDSDRLGAADTDEQSEDSIERLLRRARSFAERFPALPEAQRLLAAVAEQTNDAAGAARAQARASELERLVTARRELEMRLSSTRLDEAGELYLALAHNHAAVGSSEKARRLLDMARGLMPNRREVHEAYTALLTDPEDVFFRLRAWRRLKEIAPVETAATVEIQRAYRRLGLVDAAAP